MRGNHKENSLIKGQIIAMYKERYLVDIEGKQIQAEVSGRFQYTHYVKSDSPQIGDFVLLRNADDHFGVIESVLERKSVLERQDVGNIKERHILAVNIDFVYICMSLNEDFHVKKLRNYLTLTYGASFDTRILLTKKDLCEDTIIYEKQLKEITNIPYRLVSVFDEEDINTLKKELEHKTAVFIGSSGVGKSTLINTLLGTSHFETNGIRMSDAQGRHTTVHRELVSLDNGGKVIDTPGIRIVSSYMVSEEAFEDIKNLAEGCRFHDCTHTKEPGCYVKKALETGALDQDRWEQYVKAMKLNAFNKQREIERERLQSKRLRKGR